MNPHDLFEALYRAKKQQQQQPPRATEPDGEPKEEVIKVPKQSSE